MYLCLITYNKNQCSGFTVLYKSTELNPLLLAAKIGVVCYEIEMDYSQIWRPK